MISLGVANLEYHIQSRASFITRLWRAITLRKSTTQYHITSIEFLCREDIKAKHKFMMGGVEFRSTGSTFNMFDHHYHVTAECIWLCHPRKKPNKLQFSYVPILKLYGDEFIRA